MNEDIDYANVPPENAQHAYHLAEAYLQGSWDAADCLDRKATIFLSVMASVATAGLAVAFRCFDQHEVALGAGVLLASIVYYAGAFWASRALKGNDYHPPGYPPASLWVEGITAKPHLYMLGTITGYEDPIRLNLQHNREKAENINGAIKSLLFSPAAFTLGWLITPAFIGL